MALYLPPEEPPFGPWRVVSLTALAARVAGEGPGPRIVAIDGRSAGGKTTLATRLHEHLSASALLHTDDIAWHHSFFGWADLLLTHVLEPARAGEAVCYRPDAWQARGREGAIVVPEGTEVVLLEGVGAARRELTPFIDAVIWVQSDLIASRARGLERDGGDAAVAFWDEWMAAERPFQAEERPWERANIVVCGTPMLPHNPETEVIVAEARA